MAIDPTAPIAALVPAQPVGDAADQAKALLALARAATANTTAVLGAIAGSPAQADLSPVAPGAGAGAHLSTPMADGGQHHAEPATGAPSAAERMTAAVRAAAAQAAPRQAGLAPMMANLDTAITRPETPEPVRQAARRILEKALPTSQPVTASTLRRAVQGSGVFLEARMARAAAFSDGTPAPRTLAEAAGGDMKAALLVLRAVVSTWLATAPETAPTPPTVATDSEAEPELASSPSRPPSGQPAGSPQGGYGPGLGVDARTLSRAAEPIGPPQTAEESSPPPAASPGLATPSLATPPVAGAGMTTPETIATLLASPRADAEAPEMPAHIEEVVEPPAGQLARPAPTPPRQPVLMVGLIEEEVLDANPAALDEEAPPPPRGVGYASPRPASAPRPPPPYAGGPTAAQPASESDLPPDLAPAELARRLLKDVGGAIARQELSQIASLPEGRHEPDRPAEAKSPRWVFDLPFQTPQGMAVAQFEINRDGGGGSEAGREVERTWRARFSLDVEPLGPVHVQVALTGAMTRVGFWAERPDAMARLREGEATLNAALRQADLTPELAFHPGSPAAPATAPGRFVDRAS